MKYSPTLHAENYNEKYCVVNQKGFYMYRNEMTAKRPETRPFLTLPFAIIKSIEKVKAGVRAGGVSP